MTGTKIVIAGYDCDEVADTTPCPKEPCMAGESQHIFFNVCREHEETGIGHAPDSFEPAFLLQNRIFVTNIKY